MIKEEYIRKQDVLNKIREVCFSKEWAQFRIENGTNGQRDFLINYIEQLQPDITPKSKTGHWIFYNEAAPALFEVTYKCSCCKRAISIPFEEIDDIYNDYPYCHCGAKMVRPQESEDK